MRGASKSKWRNHPPDLPPPPSTYKLTVLSPGAGGGYVTGNNAIDSRTNPIVNLAPGTSVTLTAHPAPGSALTFNSWSGSQTGTVNPKTFTLNANSTVSCHFNLVPWRGGGITGHGATDLVTGEYSWYYNWTRTSGLTTSAQFVPMIFNGAEAQSDLSALHVSDPTNNYLLGFNEPDGTGADHLTPTEALNLWPNLMATGRQLGSPANVYGAGGDNWRGDFMAGAASRGYQVDFMCLHYYGSYVPAANLRNFLNTVYGNYGGNSNSPWYGTPIWLTEFDAYNGSLAQNTTFAQAVGPLLEDLPFLHRVGWFTNRSIAGAGGYNNVGLCNSLGDLTTVGKAYNAWPSSFGG